MTFDITSTWDWLHHFSVSFQCLGKKRFLAVTKQLYEWYFLSVCLSVTPFWLFPSSDLHEIFRSYYQTVTPVRIHIWWWNDAYSLMLLRRGALLFLAAAKQLYKWFSPSVCPSVYPSVCLSVTPFWLCFHHRIIMKFSGVITNDQGKTHAKGQGQRSKVKVTEITTQLNRFRTVTPVLIHKWWWNDA